MSVLGGKHLKRRAVFSGLACGLGLGFMGLWAWLAFSDLRVPQTPISPIVSQEGVETSADTSDQSTLAESILAIVQSYYVDVDRVDSKHLLKSTLAFLDSQPNVQVKWVDDSRIVISKKGASRTFDVPSPLTITTLQALLVGIAPMFDAKREGVINGTEDAQAIKGSAQILNAMLSGLDAHSSLLSPESYRELRQGTDGAFGGLGVLVGIRNQMLTVVKPLPNSPAMRSGIRKHDRILSINGVNTYGYALDQLVEYMRGDPGTKVDLRVLRDNDISPFNMSMKREVIQVDSVSSTEIRDGENAILHVTIDSFASRTSKELWNAIKAAKRNNKGKLEGLIMDLRSNPGGLLDQAVQVADMFLKSGVIVTTKGRRQEVESADSGYDEVDYPIVVLMDGDSASASEIVAGALQDHGRALVIGQPSFGKGSVQTIFELPGDYALKLTIARYYTPSGRSIQNVGIVPDIWLQPVVHKSSNENLFGNFRYKNERFLLNHLEEATAANLMDVKDPSVIGYYLREPTDTSDEPKLPDREMEMAVRVIRKVAKTYGTSLPQGMRRASHWLALASREVKELNDSISQSVGTWTNKSFKVDWSKASDVRRTAQLSLVVGEIPRTLVRPGEPIDIPWKLTNTGPALVGHLSLFVRSDRTSFDTKEILVGAIGPKEVKAGVLTVNVPTYWEPGDLDFTLGVAEDSQILPTPSKRIDFQVEMRTVPVLSVDVDLTQESGGSILQCLESGEHAKVRLHVANRGKSIARDVTVQLVNLSGKQLKLEAQTKTLKALGSDEEVDVLFDVEAGDQLFTRDLPVGVSIQSNDLELPLRKHVRLIGLPNVDKQRAPDVAH